MRVRAFHRPILLSLAVLSASTAARADLWYEHYGKAGEALKSQNWTEAINQLNQAIEKKGDPGVGVRTYGMNFINYHPYLKLGIAYYNLGQYDAALQAFTTEEGLGAIAKSRTDLNDLQKFRKLAEDAKKSSGAVSEEQRIAGIVKKGLDDARELEQKGQLDEAMNALGKVLAVEPKNDKATGAMARIREAVAAREKVRELETRLAGLINDGKSLLASGKYEEASSVLNQAISLKPSAEAKALLDESQQKLRARIEESQTTHQRQTLISEGLAEAARKEKAGQFPEALQKLQSVLAVDSHNQEALALQARLVKAQSEAESVKAKTEQIASLLQDGETELRNGNYEKSLIAYNRVIGLDPGNPSALSAVGKVYAALSRPLAPGETPLKIAPIISLPDLTNEEERKVRWQRVSSPDYVLTGSVFHPSQVRLSFLEGEKDVSGDSKVVVQRIGTYYVHTFALPCRLVPGDSILRVRATDQDGLVRDADYQVRYVRPLTRSPWLYSGLAALAGASLVASMGYRIKRRNRFLKRRFNPYIAGAPVLNDDIFVGRETLLSRILQTIHNNSILLYGERRIGKTTLQHHLKKRLELVKDPKYDFYPVYIDLQGTPEERFFATLGEEIFEQMSSVLNGARPGRNAAPGAPYSYEIFVRDVRDVLGTLKKSSPKKVKLVLLIDEVDELNAYDPRINQKLRSLFMKNFAEDMVAVVSGVAIKKHWASEGSPWYNFFEEIEVKAFTAQDARELIEKPIRGIFKLEDGVVDRIIERTECRPYRIQKMCTALVNRLHEEKRRRITLADVEAAGQAAEA